MAVTKRMYFASRSFRRRFVRSVPTGANVASRFTPALLVSIVALGVSVASSYQSRTTARDSAGTSIIRQEYAVFMLRPY